MKTKPKTPKWPRLWCALDGVGNPLLLGGGKGMLGTKTAAEKTARYWRGQFPEWGPYRIGKVVPA